MLVDHQTGTRISRQGGVWKHSYKHHHRGAQVVGAALGSRSFLEEYVGEKVDEFHSLRLAMQPSLLVCGTVGHIS